MLLVESATPRWPVTHVDDGLLELTGFAAEELVGREWPPLWRGEIARTREVVRLTAALRDGEPAKERVATERRDRSTVPTEVTLTPVRGVAPATVRVLRVARLDASAELERLAYHDGLTGLANRALLERDLELALSRALRHELALALLFVDLDRFKAVNDTLGHAAGDAVLVEVARRLREVVRAHDLLVRLGGDEFVIVLTDLRGDAAAKAARVEAGVHDALAAPFHVGGREVRLGASVGVAVFPEAGSPSSAAELLARADAGMYAAKRGRRFDASHLDVARQLDALIRRAEEEQERSARVHRTVVDLHASSRALRAEIARSRARRDAGPG